MQQHAVFAAATLSIIAIWLLWLAFHSIELNCLVDYLKWDMKLYLLENVSANRIVYGQLWLVHTDT